MPEGAWRDDLLDLCTLDLRTLVRRQSAYLSNASARDTLLIEVEPWIRDPFSAGDHDAEDTPLRLCLNFRMYREADGRLMMVSTAHKSIWQKTTRDALSLFAGIRRQNQTGGRSRKSVNLINCAFWAPPMLKTPVSMPRAREQDSESARCLSFDVYGYRFTVRSTADKPLRGIEEDFGFFSSEPSCSEPGAAGVLIELFLENPGAEMLPSSDAVIYTPRNVTYRERGLRFIDYHGRGLGIQDEATSCFRLYSTDPELLYEATYLYLLSQIGQRLDPAGLHRVHAVGVVIQNRAVLVMLPMGGGKSTVGLHLLRHPQVGILSDDSPFVDRNGRLLAFPLRLGLLPGSEHTVPAEYRRTINRMEFGPKHLVNYGYFRDRVRASAEPGLLFIGTRTMSPQCRIEPVGRLTALRSCITHCVVGVGLFQGLEFILQATPWELMKKSGLGMSRLWNCWQLIRRSQVCRIRLGRDSEVNARTLLEFAERSLGGGKAEITTEGFNPNQNAS